MSMMKFLTVVAAGRQLNGMRRMPMFDYCTTEHCSCMGIKQFSAGKAIRCMAESCKNKSEPSCGSCKWYAEPESVCMNDQSEHVADFVWDERGCKEWEKKDETSADL
jgi:hypothetical protein